jgi:hypothetical protein
MAGNLIVAIVKGYAWDARGLQKDKAEEDSIAGPASRG